MTRRIRAVAAAVALAVLTGVVAVSCRSLPKDEVEARLLGLPKNARTREHGLERRRIPMRLAGEDVGAEVTVLSVSRRDASGPSRRPVVLVHGTPGSLFTWGDVVFGSDASRGLADDFDVYAIDVLGHGTTRTEARPVSFAKCAEWIAGTIRGLDVGGPVHLVGQSYGGEFCWRVAASHPELVASLTLLDSSGFPRPDDGWLPEEVAMREMWLAPIGWAVSDAEKIRGALQPHFAYPVTDDQVEECLAICRNADNWKSMVDLARDENGTAAADLARIRAPTLLVWGADDIAYPPQRDAERFRTAIPGSRLVVLPGVGHYPQETVPARVVELIREHAAGAR